MKVLLLLGLTAFAFCPACSLNVGPHVDTRSVMVTKYTCNYSDGKFLADRLIAICETQQECNDICLKLQPK